MVQYYGPREDLGFRFVHSYVLPFPEWPALVHVSEASFIPGHRGHEHIHHCTEITYVISGAGERHVHGHAHRIKPCDYHVVTPGELHRSYADRQDPFRYVTIGLRTDLLPVAASAEVGLAFARIQALTGRIVPGGKGGERAFRRLIAELSQAEADPQLRPLRLMMVQTLVAEIVLRDTRCVHSGDSPQAAEPETVSPPNEALLAWMGARLGRPPGIPEMAARLGLSPGHFIATFRRELGRTPIAYLTALRIAEASRRLAGSDDAIASIAEDLGFCSSRYFSQVFRRERGCTPRAWRERHGS